jgi:hypothetical protein
MHQHHLCGVLDGRSLLQPVCEISAPQQFLGTIRAGNHITTE